MIAAHVHFRGNFSCDIIPRNQVFIIGMALIALFKVAIIWGNETISEGSDSVSYLYYAFDWFYGSPAFPQRGPVFPLWIALCKLFHIPLRIGTELLFIASAATLSWSLRRLIVHPFLATLIFAGIVLHPATFLALDMPMSEGLFAVITFGWLSTAICLLTTASFKSRLACGIALGFEGALLMNERGNDAALIYLMIGYSFAAVWLAAWAEGPSKASFGLAAVVAAAIIMSAVAGNAIWYTANYIAFGQFGPNEVLSPGEQKLVSSLVSIDTGEPPIHKWIVVTNKALEIAFGLSPTLATFRDVISKFRSDTENNAFSGSSRTGIKGQFDITDIFILTATILKPPPDFPGEASKRADQFMAKIAQEIDDGLREGRAKKRFTVYIWSPASPLLRAAVKESAAHIFASLFRIKTKILLDDYPFYGSIVSPLYDEMSTRRPRKLIKGPLVGFISVDPDAGSSL